MLRQKKAAGEAVMEAHYTSEQLAGLPGMPARSGDVPRRMKSLGIDGRPKEGQGGGREWPLSRLPRETQVALVSVSTSPTQPFSSTGSSSPVVDLRAASFSSDPRAEQLAAIFERKTEKQKAAARALLALVQECHQLVGQGFTWRGVAPALAAKHNVSAATLSRAWKKVRREPAHLWLYLLCKGYAGRQAKSDMSAEAWEILQADYLRLERPTAKACIDRLRRAAAARSDWIIPADRTLERRLDAIPDVIKVLRRDGVSAAKDLFPPQQRLKAALAALDIVNGDGYQHNVWVRFPDGEIVRAKTWYWQDVHSARILAWRTDKSEHTDVIRLSFGDLVESYGIPGKVLLDNTLAAANKTMTGGVKHRFRFKVREDEPLGIFPLVIGPDPIIWATPGHGQAKPVERAFGIGGVGEYIDKAPELAGAWTGGSPLDKPEYDGKHRVIELADLERVIAREIAAWNAREGRRGAMNAGGKSCDAIFQASYSVAPIRRAVESQRRLWLLATEPVRASSRNGEITLDAGRVVGERVSNRYWSVELVDYAGRQVVARFDPKRLHEGVHVYALDGRYIAFAECVQAAGFNDANAGREHNRARQGYLRAVRQKAESEIRMDALQAAKALAGTDAPVIPAPAAPARGKVVRGEFRDPLERPALPDVSDTPEEAAERAALAAEMRREATPIHEDDEWAVHRRWRAIGERIAAGQDVDEQALAWHAAYGQSDECRAMQGLAEDFPHKLMESAA